MMDVSMVKVRGLIRGPEPRGNVEWLQLCFGVTDVVCLQRGWFDLFNELLRGKKPVIDELRSECVRLGVTFYEIPCSDFRHPTWKQTRNFLMLTTKLIEKERVVYVHCKKGKDRTGWMCAAFRVLSMQWTVNEAVTEWKSMGFNRRLYFWWEKAFRGTVVGG